MPVPVRPRGGGGSAGAKAAPYSTICTATIALAHNLGLAVIAEGVETEAQRDLLVSHHCDFMQGFLFSRPLQADAVLAFIRKRQAA